MADKYTQSEVDDLGAKGQAFENPDGTYSYPVADEEDLKNAISAVGLGNADHDDIRKYLIGRAKDLGLSELIPDTWNADGSMKDETKSALSQEMLALMKDEMAARDQELIAALSGKPGRRPRAGRNRPLDLQPKFRRFQVGNLEVRSTGTTDAPSDLVEVTGQVIVYDTPYEVYDMFGSFTETIHFGACAPVLAVADLDVRFQVNHSDMPLARTGAEASLFLTDTPSGLNVTALIDPRQSGANDLIVCLERGTVTQMSVGMEVDPTGDVWSGEDDWGMPNVRDIFRLANIFDVSAVTFPASPTTTLALADRMSSMPPEITERTQRLWAIAKEGRKGILTQADSDILLHLIERLHDVAEPDDRSAPTPQDANVSKAIIAAHSAVASALAAQSKDPDNNTDPVDKQVWKQLSAAQDALTAAMKSQSKDGAPDTDDKGNADGTDAGSGDTTSGSENGDGTGFRSHAIDVDLDLLRLHRRPISV